MPMRIQKRKPRMEPPAAPCPHCQKEVSMVIFTDSQVQSERGRRMAANVKWPEVWEKHRQGFKGCRCQKCIDDRAEYARNHELAMQRFEALGYRLKKNGMPEGDGTVPRRSQVEWGTRRENVGKVRKGIRDQG